MRDNAMTRGLKGFAGRNPEFASILVISVLCFLIFYVLFQQVSRIEYLREIISALIATILTVTITTLLLKTQKEGEEAKERNVEILRRKIDSYNVFMDAIIDTMDEDEITDVEAKKLRKNLYHLSLFSSAATVESVVSFLRPHLLSDMEKPEFISVVQAFREELRLDTSDESLGSSDLEAVDRLIAFGFSNKNAYTAVMDATYAMNDYLKKAIAQTTAQSVDVDYPVGTLSGLAITMTRRDKVEYRLMIDYPESKDFESVDLYFLIDLSGTAPSTASALEGAASKRGFEWPDDGHKVSKSDLIREDLLAKQFTLKCETAEDGTLAVSWRTVAKKIVDDIAFFELDAPAAVAAEAT